MLSPGDFERLPDSALAELALLFEACDYHLAWPAQVPMIVGRVLPKKSAGDSIIGLVSMVGRLWSLIREPLVRQWSSDTEASWDAAVRGNSSLREAFVRALQQEVPHHLGIAVGEGLVDIKSFYDSIEWPGLVLCSPNLSFPPRIFYLELLQCAAART
eukprot:3626697-Pyramimonas_sp.AAC.1